MEKRKWSQDKVCEGKRYKVKNLRKGVTKLGVPYWSFSFNFFYDNGFSVIPYKHINLLSRGEKCVVEEGDWVELEEIVEFFSNRTITSRGGVIVFDTLVCKFKKINEEDWNEK